MIDPLLLHLARRVRYLRTAVRRHCGSGNRSMPWLEYYYRLSGAENEAWNSFQAAKQIDAERRATRGNESWS